MRLVPECFTPPRRAPRIASRQVFCRALGPRRLVRNKETPIMTSRLALVLAAANLVSACALAAEVPNEKHFTNSLGMKLVRIEPGSFVMGQGDAPPETQEQWLERDADESPAHRVRILDGLLSRRQEVTNAQYERFDPAHKKLRGGDRVGRADDEPASLVTWQQAADFCRWLSETEGRPTGCRPRPNGNTPAAPARRAPFRPASGSRPARRTSDWTAAESSSLSPLRSEAIRRTLGACTTCTATSRSGASTGTGPTRPASRSIRWAGPMVTPGSPAAAASTCIPRSLGWATHAIAGRRTARLLAGGREPLRRFSRGPGRDAGDEAAWAGRPALEPAGR